MFLLEEFDRVDRLVLMVDFHVNLILLQTPHTANNLNYLVENVIIVYRHWSLSYTKEVSRHWQDI